LVSASSHSIAKIKVVNLLQAAYHRRACLAALPARLLLLMQVAVKQLSTDVSTGPNSHQHSGMYDKPGGGAQKSDGHHLQKSETAPGTPHPPLPAAKRAYRALGFVYIILVYLILLLHTPTPRSTLVEESRNRSDLNSRVGHIAPKGSRDMPNNNRTYALSTTERARSSWHCNLGARPLLPRGS